MTKVLTDKENDEMFDTLCEEMAQNKGYADYTEYYREGNPEECYRSVYKICRAIFKG